MRLQDLPDLFCCMECVTFSLAAHYHQYFHILPAPVQVLCIHLTGRKKKTVRVLDDSAGSGYANQAFSHEGKNVIDFCLVVIADLHSFSTLRILSGFVYFILTFL